MALYTRISQIEAEQFLVSVTPWPADVIATQESPTGYLFDGGQIGIYICPGDYIVTNPRTGNRNVVARVLFEDQYELVPGELLFRAM